MSTNNRIRGRALQRIRQRVLAARPLCIRCEAKGRVREATQVDHRIPVTHGGSDDPYDDSNRDPLCAECHDEKTRQDMGYKAKQDAKPQSRPRLKMAQSIVRCRGMRTDGH